MINDWNLIIILILKKIFLQEAHKLQKPISINPSLAHLCPLANRISENLSIGEVEANPVVSCEEFKFSGALESALDPARDLGDNSANNLILEFN